MNMPFYVAPEQVMKDRADYARKGIARGRALIAMTFAEGILIVAGGSEASTNEYVDAIFNFDEYLREIAPPDEKP